MAWNRGRATSQLYWRDRTRTGPTFHIDYIFVPRPATNLLRRVSVGSYAKWVATGLSDHAPLIVDFLSEFASKKPPNTAQQPATSLRF
jgi:hypothetical protein